LSPPPSPTRKRFETAHEARRRHRTRSKSPAGESRRMKESMWVKHLTAAMGTTRWMAPELFVSKNSAFEYGPAVDVYAFGILMCEVLTLRRPWPSLSRQSIFAKVREGGRPYVRDTVRDEAPEHYVELMEMCWQQNSHLRPSIGFVLNTLKHDIIVTTKTFSATSSTTSSILESRRQSIISTRRSSCASASSWRSRHGSESGEKRSRMSTIAAIHRRTTSAPIDLERKGSSDFEYEGDERSRSEVAIELGAI